MLVKKEIEKLLEVGFIRPIDYSKWMANLVPVKKSTSEKATQHFKTHQQLEKPTNYHKEKVAQHFKIHQQLEPSKFIPYTPYNIMEELKKMPSRVTIFDALKIPGQLDLLQEPLKLRNS